MKAMVHSGAGHFEIAEVPDAAPGAGQLVVRVDACGICGSDLKTAAIMPPGTIMGHEFCGQVTAVGPDVDPQWKEGAVVSAMPLACCGRCRWCLTGEVAHCEEVVYQGLGASAGGFAQYVTVAAATTFRLDPAVGRYGALVEPLAVGLHAVAAARIQPEDKVLILGGGAVGCTVLFWARRLGAASITVSDPAPDRRTAAQRLGADRTVDPADGLPSDRFDVVFECVGGAGMVQSCLDSVAVRGRVVVAGVCTVPDQVHHLPALMKEADIRYAVYYTKPEFESASRLVAEQQLDFDLFVEGSTGFAGFDTTFSALTHGQRKGKHLFLPHMDVT